MMPVISASGAYGPPLFIFEGNRIYFYRAVVNGLLVEWPRTDTLPGDAVVATRENLAGVDSSIFL